MFVAIIEGSVLKVHQKERDDAKGGKVVTPVFDVYERGGGALLTIEGNGVKEGDLFKGPVEIGLLTGVSGKGKAYSFQTLRKHEVSPSAKK